MSGRNPLAIVKSAALAAMLALLLNGCAYDYLQHTDRVGYGAGDAVKANLEGETIDPSSTDVTTGLGKTGLVPTTPAT